MVVEFATGGTISYPRGIAKPAITAKGAKIMFITRGVGAGLSSSQQIRTIKAEITMQFGSRRGGRIGVSVSWPGFSHRQLASSPRSDPAAAFDIMAILRRPMIWPPSTTSSLPVTRRDSSDDR